MRVSFYFLTVALICFSIAWPVQASWVKQHQGQIPINAQAVDPQAMTPLYLCRAHFNKGLHPGQLKPGSHGCLVSSAGRTTYARHYEVLLNDDNYQWLPGDDDLSSGLSAGTEGLNSTYIFYICRARWQGHWYPGKIRRHVLGCRIADEDAEYAVHEYEFLSIAPKPQQNITKNFPEPLHNEYHLASCLTPDQNCGQAVALTWCQRQGFRHAEEWQLKQLGRGTHAQYLGNDALCSGETTCQGFQFIRCAEPLGFSGQWVVQRGDMTATLSLPLAENQQMSGNYDYQQGSLQGFVNEDRFWGQWREKDQQGVFEFWLNPHQQSFSGRWRYVEDSQWRTTPWQGQRQLAPAH